MRNGKFDCVLMNPPYNRSLHLRFLEKAIRLSEKCVSIQPVTFLQNAFADQNKKSSFNKFNKIKITDIEFLGKINNFFDGIGGATYDVGIFYIDKNATIKEDFLYNMIELYPNKFIDGKLIKSIKSKILDWCKNNNLESHIIKDKEIDENTKYVIVMPKLIGAVGYKSTFIFYWENSARWGRIFYKGISDGKAASEYKHRFSNVTNYTNFDFLEFDTEEECKNWIKSQHSDIMRFIVLINFVNSNRRCKNVPYMNDYSIIWTDEKLAEFFGITDDEQNMIRGYIKLYDKYYN